MKSGQKKRRTSSFVKQLREIRHKYTDATGIKTVDMFPLATWAYEKGLIDPPKSDPIRDIARMLSRAAAKEYLDGEAETPVRRTHSYSINQNGRQQTFWVEMEDATPHQIKMSATQKRNLAIQICSQTERDVSYYNKHHNPGDQLLMQWDLTKDVNENSQPTEWPDSRHQNRTASSWPHAWKPNAPPPPSLQSPIAFSL